MSLADISIVAAPYLAAINVISWLAFRSDKRRAVTRQPRIPERRLLWGAALGGSPAALIARKRFRHKTRKQPFTNRLFGIVFLQAVAGIGLVWLIR